MTTQVLPDRTYLGCSRAILQESIRVYRCGDALEYDCSEGYHIETRRIFFDDVLLITHHARRSRKGLWLSSIFLACTLLVSVIVIIGESGRLDPWFSIFIAILTGVVPGTLLLLAFLRPFVVVTIFGVRSRAVLTFHWRHDRADSVFDELTQAVKAHQSGHQSTENNPPNEMNPIGLPSMP